MKRETDDFNHAFENERDEEGWLVASPRVCVTTLIRLVRMRDRLYGYLRAVAIAVRLALVGRKLYSSSLTISNYLHLTDTIPPHPPTEDP
jgi:hypothetical protein